jgi:hypothetical protein
MHTSRLVPRAIAWLGLIGGSVILSSAIAVLFGAYDQDGTVGLVLALPVSAWEVGLALWLIVKGFRDPPAGRRTTSPTRSTGELPVG